MVILETERLFFRHLEPRDLNELFELYSDPEIRQFFPDGSRTFEETKEELEWFLNGHPRHPELGLWATILKEDGAFIGRCGLLPWEIDGVLEIEIAYLIAKRHWRRGLGSEAAKALVGYAFDTLGLDRVIALTDEDHKASIRTAESAGLKFDKAILMDGVTSHVYAISKGDR